MAWALDLDGVIWLADQPIPGACEAVAELRRAGERIVFVTNSSSATVVDVETKLARMGIDAAGAVLTSGLAAAGLLAPGSRAMVCGGPGVVDALTHRGVDVVRAGSAPPPSVDAVVVGYHGDFTYDTLAAAVAAVRSGARFIATNDDATYPTPAGTIPGGGAIVAFVATAAGVSPEVAGKPYPPMVDLVRASTGASDGVVVGDQPSTDGMLARRLGWRFGLVLSGVTGAADLPAEPTPDYVADDLGTLCAAAELR